MPRQLLQSLPASTQAAMESLTALMLIGSTVSANLRQRIRERLCSRLCVLYGTNESGTLCATEWQDVYQVPGTVGRPQSGFRLEVVDAHDAAVPAGQPGQVRIQGPAMIDGYLDDEPATARAFRNGWFYPGDLGRLTPDGQLIHLGRSDDMMIVNGINIYPAEIEQVLTAHPAVREAAAMPLKHAVHQDVPVCAVSLVEGARVDAQALLSFARERLGAHALQQVVMLDRIPRNDRGKPDREALKASIALRLGRSAGCRQTRGGDIRRADSVAGQANAKAFHDCVRRSGTGGPGTARCLACRSPANRPGRSAGVGSICPDRSRPVQAGPGLAVALPAAREGAAAGRPHPRL